MYAMEMKESDVIREKLVSTVKPTYKTFEGRYVYLQPLNISEDIPRLYEKTHLTKEKMEVWKYIPYGPFSTHEEMGEFYEKLLLCENRLIFCVNDTLTKTPIGVISLENIESFHATLEIGGIIYSIEG